MIRIREGDTYKHKHTLLLRATPTVRGQRGLAEGFCFLTTLRKNCIASIARYTQIQIQIEIKK